MKVTVQFTQRIRCDKRLLQGIQGQRRGGIPRCPLLPAQMNSPRWSWADRRRRARRPKAHKRPLSRAPAQIFLRRKRLFLPHDESQPVRFSSSLGLTNWNCEARKLSSVTCAPSPPKTRISPLEQGCLIPVWILLFGSLFSNIWLTGLPDSDEAV